jgi:3-dehydroquinate synthase
LRSSEALTEITDVITALYPKYFIEEAANDQLYALMLKDKKNQSGKINCTLLKQIGQYSIDNICTEAELRESLYYYATL